MISRTYSGGQSTYHDLWLLRQTIEMFGGVSKKGKLEKDLKSLTNRSHGLIRFRRNAEK